MAKVVLENISKNFGTVQAVRDFNLTVEDKEVCVLLGPSGCGKSTALRTVAGLEEPTTSESMSRKGFTDVRQVPISLSSDL